MTQPFILRLRSPSALLPLAMLLVSTLLAGCSISASSRSSTAADADAKGRSSGRSESRGNSRASVHGSAKAEVKAGGSSKGNADVSSKANGKASGKSSSKVVFKSKKRVSGVGKAKGGDHFKATALVGGKGKVKINGKVTGSAGTKADASSKGKSGSSTSSSGGKGSVKVSTGGSTKTGGSIKGGGSAKAEGKGSVRVDSKGASNADKAASLENDKSKGDKSKGDKPDAQIPDVPVVIDPPDEAPENDFGYDTPVRGCFEGIVYPLAPQTKKLPTTWDPADGISVVYACEWDIPTRKWETGFPGVEDRFEWFAIQYSGSFNVETAGKWKFRISSDDGSKLYIDGKLVLDNDGEHPPKEAEIEVDLAAGDHEMVLEYFQGPRYHINLQLYATPPGGEEGIFSVR